ncbi:MAG: MltA domain-containing protein [Leptolyngbyaceae bacterium]|nr:MltA domain-containing protein [Leptolyngbyaceae bacterium]
MKSHALKCGLSAAIALSVGIGIHQPAQGNESPSSLPGSSPSATDVIRVEPTTEEQTAIEPDDILVPVPPEHLPSLVSSDFGWDDRLWGDGWTDDWADLWGDAGGGDRQQLITAINYSLAYLNTPAAETAYSDYPIPAFTRDRVRRSLERFRTLLQTEPSATALQQSVLNEFVFYRSVGHDGLGTVDFTGYFEPTYVASRVPTAQYRYPLYRRPLDLEEWDEPHPTRIELEGRDGLQGDQGRLSGYELVWLGDRLEAFLIQVQGSARLQLTDGTEMSVGYAGRTNYPYQSIGRRLIEDGHVPEEGLSLPKVLEFFETNPSALDQYLPQNNRFVFFRETFGAPPQGTLSVPVTTERSIATDKSIMPPGALALIVTDIPFTSASSSSEFDTSNPGSIEDSSTEEPPQHLDHIQPNQWVQRRVHRYVLDQDTGGAIQGPGRVDIFMGTGQEAGERAGLINTPGSLYYMLLHE